MNTFSYNIVNFVMNFITIVESQVKSNVNYNSLVPSAIKWKLCSIMLLKQVFSKSSDFLPLWYMSNYMIENHKDQTRYNPFQMSYVCYPQNNIHCTIGKKFIMMLKQQFNGPSNEIIKSCLTMKPLGS